jgi:hypothetical protein
MKGCVKEFELGGNLGVQDVDREIAFTLLSLAHEFDRWEIDQVVAYVIRSRDEEVGRLVIAPGPGAGQPVRIREHHTVPEQRDDAAQPQGDGSGLYPEFVDLCHHIHQTLKALHDVRAAGGGGEADPCRRTAPAAARSARGAPGVPQDSCHFAYPPSKRMQIVRHYRLDRLEGEAHNKDHWARKNYQISGRTLFNYEREFPQVEE